jgi:hypothetical protein
MTWTEFYRLFDDQYKQTHARLHDAIIKKIPIPHLKETKYPDRETLLAADTACEYFAENRKWPIMSESVAWECFGRFRAARDFCRFVSCPERPNVEFAESEAKKLKSRYSDSEIIRWILVDYWWHAGMWVDLYHGPVEK